MRDALFLHRQTINRLQKEIRQQCISMPLVMREIPVVDELLEATGEYAGLKEEDVLARSLGARGFAEPEPCVWRVWVTCGAFWVRWGQFGADARLRWGGCGVGLAGRVGVGLEWFG